MLLLFFPTHTKVSKRRKKKKKKTNVTDARKAVLELEDLGHCISSADRVVGTLDDKVELFKGFDDVGVIRPVGRGAAEQLLEEKRIAEDALERSHHKRAKGKRVTLWEFVNFFNKLNEAGVVLE